MKQMLFFPLKKTKVLKFVQTTLTTNILNMRILLFVLLIFLLACRSSSEPNDEKAVEVVNPTTSTDSLPSLTKVEVKIPNIDYDSTQWTDIQILDGSISLDLRYATPFNFVKEKMYNCGRCFLRKEVASQIARIHKELQEEGLGLKMFDCYRPRPIQWKLWEKVPDPRYVADPRKGSMHNRGSAVDLTLVDEKGNELDMGTAFDFFGPEAYHNYTGHPTAILENRKKLKGIMEKHGFRPTSTEWWHYSYRRKSYKLADWLWDCR
jgi:D-alanyl-D-alanine dipeptidase